MTEEKVKRTRGNPNWIKRGEENAAKRDSDPITTKVSDNVSYKYDVPESVVWAKFYASIIGTYSSCGQGTLIAAAQNADFALQEFKKRFPK